MKLYEIITRSAWSAISCQHPNGSLNAGHNGLYFDKETSVRNTAHWMIVFSRTYEWTGEKIFFDAARKAAFFLLSQPARPNGFSFWHRDMPGKDRCNGLIGQAWTIEALAECAMILEMEEMIKIAAEVFFQHSYDQNNHLWRRLDIDGKLLSIDLTFNHQLWFAGAGSILYHYTKNNRISDLIEDFLNNLKTNLKIHRSGLIKHIITRNDYKQRLKNLIFIISPNKIRSSMMEKEIGYQSFNLYAFALIKKYYTKITEEDKINKAIAFTTSDEYLKNIVNNRYAFPYNPAGIENAFCYFIFNPELYQTNKDMLFYQFKHFFNFKTNLFDKKTEDPKTLSARIYEATRLPDIEIER
jgi:hypothetical protein